MTVADLSPEVQIALNLVCFFVGVGAGFLFGGGRNGNHA